MLLRTNDDRLRDIVAGEPTLNDSSSGQPTGVRLLRWLGAGGMSTVFAAAFDQHSDSEVISPSAPERLAIKLNRISTQRHLERMNFDPLQFMRKELSALARLMAVTPPTDFVIGYYGHGTVDVVTSSRVERIPWLALELVDGGPYGCTLGERVAAATAGIDPVRALRLSRGIIEGLAALHRMGIIHRDLKPENIFVSGALDDEIPKIADLGIARVVDLSVGTVAAVTPDYAGPEQMVPGADPTQPNPLIGPWTDVHALAAVIWFMVAGEPWCQGQRDDDAWHAGVRRGLRTAESLHPGFAHEPDLLAELDRVLCRGASHGLPAAVWGAEGAQGYRLIARLHFGDSLLADEARYADVASFRDELLGVLELFAARWERLAAEQGCAATSTRRMLLPQACHFSVREIGCELAWQRIAAAPGDATFLPDGRVLIRFGGRLVFLAGKRAHAVVVPPQWAGTIETALWLGRGSRGGFALAVTEGLLLIVGGEFSLVPYPDGVCHSSLVAFVGDGRALALLSGVGPTELHSFDGARWCQPVGMEFEGRPAALAVGPMSTLVVGVGHNGGCATMRATDGQTTQFALGVATPALTVAGTEHQFWIAGNQLVFRIDGSGVTREAFDAAPESVLVALEVDAFGTPWLLSARAAWRRELIGQTPGWCRCYQRPPQFADLVALGFHANGAVAIDKHGGRVVIDVR